MADVSHPTGATVGDTSAPSGPSPSGTPPLGAAASGAPPGDAPPSGRQGTPVVVKKYANRRLYNTETSSYITLDNLADMIRAGRDFVVYDAKSGDDITRGVLTQIIVEEESKGTSMLPTAFLRQLIGFYGDSLQGVVPRYLETAMSSFARQQQTLRQAVQQTISPFLPAGVEEMSRQNLAMIERAMSMFNPFHRGAEPPPGPAAAAPAEAGELDRLRQEVEILRQQLAAAQAGSVAAEVELAGAGASDAGPVAARGGPGADGVGTEVATALPPASAGAAPDAPQAGPDNPVTGEPAEPGPMDAGPVGGPAAPAHGGDPLPAPEAGAHPGEVPALRLQLDADRPAIMAAEPPHAGPSVTETAIHHAVDAVSGQALRHPDPAAVNAAVAGVNGRRGRTQRTKT